MDEYVRRRAGGPIRSMMRGGRILPGVFVPAEFPSARPAAAPQQAQVGKGPPTRQLLTRAMFHFRGQQNENFQSADFCDFADFLPTESSFFKVFSSIIIRRSRRDRFGTSNRRILMRAAFHIREMAPEKTTPEKMKISAVPIFEILLMIKFRIISSGEGI